MSHLDNVRALRNVECRVSSHETKNEKQFCPLPTTLSIRQWLCVRNGLKFSALRARSRRKVPAFFGDLSNAVNHASNLGKLHLKWQPLRWSGKVFPMEIADSAETESLRYHMYTSCTRSVSLTLITLEEMPETKMQKHISTVNCTTRKI